ncbi:winged helix-turn-helix domain-containing protein [Bradyrhizobium sp. Tv2a-2]|uniref:winged helix-turn-helix domain-containing protein n=1 Tax=Bradyrhizobium sp. Tv2a-2 TaxID=113395 RepID=UPI0004634EF4|nr:winged helix-turn-helix domain-containing protein [Bradyrhizobium sp. Tv2a-2]
MTIDYRASSHDQQQQTGSAHLGTTSAGRILVMDDDLEMHDVIAHYLEEHGFSVVSASSSPSVPRLLAMSELSLILLSLRSAQHHRLDVVREIRSHSNLPIIIMDHAPNGTDGVVALELGADDYIAGPVALRELLARVRAKLRRRQMARPGRGRQTDRGGYRFGGWQLQRAKRQLIDPSGMPVRLTKGRYALLVAFLDAPRRPLTRAYLVQATHVHEDVIDRSIDVQVVRLRRKLEPNASSPQMILTERGVGYLFACDVERY